MAEIHPSAIVYEGTVLGDGVRVLENAVVGKQPSLGPRSTTKRDPLPPARIGDKTIVSTGAIVFAGSTVGGNVGSHRCEVADVQDSTVKGNQEDNGVSEGAFISNSHINGNLHIQHGTDFFGSGFHIDGNTIGDNLGFNQNTGTSDISANTIGGNLHCNGNTPPPLGGGNTAQQKTGQCAAL